MEISESGEISVDYRIPLHDGSFTTYSLKAEFEPEEPRVVFDEINRRVEAAASQRETAGRKSDPP